MNTKYLEEHLDSLEQKTGVPAYNIKIMKDRKVIFSRHKGYSNVQTKREMTTDSLVNLYSCTKVITCTAGMQLVERGKIMLHESVATYLPEFANIKVKERVDGKIVLRDPKRELRIYDLFSMMSGLSYNLEYPSIIACREKTNGRCPTVELVRGLASEPLEFDPGSRYCYSLSHDVLGALIEVVSGMSFGEYLKKNIFDVVGMKDTGFFVSEENKHRYADQYRCEGGVVRPVSQDCVYKLGTEYESGGAGLISCTDDYILFADALANGGVAQSGERVLSPRAIDTMRTSRITPELAHTYTHTHFGQGYGLGVRTCVTHAGGTLIPLGAFGWDGAAGSFVLIDPENHAAIFYCQHMIGNSGNAYKDVRTANIVYSDIIE